MYCGDYCSDPPDRCQPCDQWGNYIGRCTDGYHSGYARGTVPQDVRIASVPEAIQAPQGTRQ
ncbi:MAG: hypothetical protein ACYSWU_24440 [Planctomycetota bacterium]